MELHSSLEAMAKDVKADTVMQPIGRSRGSRGFLSCAVLVPGFWNVLKSDDFI